MGKHLIPNVIKLVYSKVEFLPSYIERQLDKEISEDIKLLLLEKFSDVLVCQVTPSTCTSKEGISTFPATSDSVLGLIRYSQFGWMKEFLWLDNVLAQGEKPFAVSRKPQVSPKEPDNVLFFLTERFLWLHNVFGGLVFSHMINRCAVFEFFSKSSVIQRAGLKISQQHWKNSRKSTVGTEKNLKRRPKTTSVMNEPQKKIAPSEVKNGKKTALVLKGFKLNRAILRRNIFHAKNFRETFVAYPLLETRRNRKGCEGIMNIMFKGVPECVSSVTKQDDFLKIIVDFVVNFQCFKMKNFLKKYCPIPHSEFRLSISKLLQQYTTHSKVFSFLRAFCYKILPLGIFGSVTNRNVFLRSLKRVCSAGIHDNLRVDWFLLNIKTQHISWLDKSLDISVQTAQLSCVIGFFLEFVLEVLKSCFYITESSSTNYYPNYYRKRIYQKITQIQIKYLETLGKLKKLTRAQINDYKERGKCYGPGSLRFVPKKDKLRPIISVTKNKLKLSAEKNLYWMLNATRSHFNYLEKTHRKKFGNSFTSTVDVYKPFKEFILQLKKEKFSKIFAVKLDIRDCFGSIKQNTLLKMVDHIHREIRVKDLKMRKYSVISLKNDNFFVTHTNGVGKDSDSFKDLIQVLHPQPSQKVYCDWNDIVTINSKDITEYVTVFVKHCVVKVAGEHYHLSNGIPQGGLLSSCLCNLYLAQVERLALKGFVIRNSDFSARFTDDILFLSTSEAQAVEYYKRMFRTCHKIGANVGHEKTFLNFKISDADIPTPYSKSNTLDWLGFTVNLKDATVKTNFSESTFKDVEYSMTIDTDQKGNRLKKKLMFMALHQWSPLILDTEINGKKIVMQSIFEKCLLFASRFDCLVRMGPKNMRLKFPSFLIGVIDGISDNIMLRTKLFKRKFGIKFSINRKIVSWICYQAFKLKLAKRSGLYKPLIILVKQKIASKRKILGQKQVSKVQKVINDKAYLNQICNMVK